MPGHIFAAPVRKDILQRVVTWHLSAKRQGTASTKSRGEVAGSGRKLYKQKGTGNARVGSIRSPVRRGGGPAHGPKPRDWYYPLPRKVRDQGLRSVLSSKLAQNKLFIVCDTNVESHKTKDLTKIFKLLKWEDVLIVEKNKFPRLELAQRNIPKTAYCKQEELSVYTILQRDILALHKNVLPYLEAKLVPAVKKAIYTNPDDELLLEVEDAEQHDTQNFEEFLKKEKVI
uniref:Large ribosomal subunit protein uL4m n=1 Tax=Arcella intermedia TaxID=1963864 RepID=A0A6B2LGE3_9EUKA